MAFVTVKDFFESEADKLKLKLLGGKKHLHAKITSPHVVRPGLALTGAARKRRPTEVLVLGNSEINYLKNMNADERRKLISDMFGQGLSCIIVCRRSVPPPDLVRTAVRMGVVVLGSSLSATETVDLCRRVLQEKLSPSTTEHGVMVDILGVGVLILGESGIGKSECALDLLLRGHRLVADDQVLLKKVGENEVMASADPVLRGHMEIRGLGIIEITRLFGSPALCEAKMVNLVIQLADWTDSDGFERLGVEEKTYDVLGCSIPLVKLPIRTGRNIASVVEVAARNQLLKMRGYHPAIDFLKKHKEKMDRAADKNKRRKQK